MYLFFLQGAFASKDGLTFKMKLRDELLDGYALSPEPPQHPTTVFIGASLIRIIDFDEFNEVVTLNTWQRMVKLHKLVYQKEMNTKDVEFHKHKALKFIGF